MLVLTACSTTKNSDKLDVKVQVWALQYLVNEIGKEHVTVSLAVEAGDAHNKEQTQKEVAALEKSNLFFYVGFGDVGVEAQELLKATNNSDSNKSVDVAARLEAVVHGEEKDPHVWLSPKQMIVMGETVTQKLSEKRPEKKSEFEANYEKLKQKLTELDTELKNIFSNKTKKSVLVEHTAYGYMARDYGFTQHGLAGNHDHDHDHDHEDESAAAGEHAELSAGQIEKLKEEVKEENIAYLFGNSQNQSEETEKVAKELGVTLEKVSTLETLSQEEAKKEYSEHVREIAQKFAKEME